MAVAHTLPAEAVIADIADFDSRSGTPAERLFFNNRLAVVAVCLLITLVLGYQAFGLRLNAAFDKMIPTGHPYIVNYLENRSQLAGMGNSLRIAVEATEGTIFDAAYLDTVRKLADELFLMPGVDRPYMKSLWAPAVRWTGVTEDGLDGGPVIPDDYDGSPESLQQVRINVERSGEIGQLVAANYKSSIILVPLQDRISETGQRIDYHALSQRIEVLRAKYGSDAVKIHVTGFAKVVGDLIDGLRQVMLFFAVAIAICTAVLYWYTRCLRSTLLVVSCSVIAVVWLLGLLPTLGYELDPYSVLVPFLVFAIGMSHGAQKMNGIMQDIGRGTHRLVAARYTFRRLFLAGLTALLADAVGFAVLMVIDIQVIQDLAVTASIGVAVLIFTNLVLLPVLLSYTGVSPVAAQRSLKAELMEANDANHAKHPFWAFLDLFTQRKWASIAIAVGLVMGAVGLAVSFQLKIGDTDPGAPELRPDSRYNRDNAFVTANYAASSDVYVVMVKTPQYACGQYGTLMAVDTLERDLAQLPGVEATSSLAGLAKVANAGMNEGSLKWFEIPRSQDMLNAIITRAPREMFNQNCDLLTVYAYLKDHKADTLSSVVRVVEDFAVQYLAVGDSRTRPSHQALNGKVFRVDDPAWSVIAPPNGFNCRCRVRNMDQRELDRRGLRVETDANIVEMPAARHRGDTVGTVQRGVSIPDRNDPTGKKRTGLWADVGWDYNPGASWLKPFAPPPLDDLPRTFAPGVVLPGLPTATRVKATALLPDGLAPEEYARAFLAEFGAEPGRGQIFEDAAGGALAIDEALFKDGAGKWKVNKNGRAPYLRLIAQAVKAPDEIWLRWEALRDKPGAYSLKRRYIKSFEIEGEDGTTQFGLGVFEFGKDGWTGSTAMVAKPDRSQAARERYIQAQRDGFLLFRK